LTVGTRGSRLSIIQTESVVEAIKRHNRTVEVETRVIKTTGDKLESEPLPLISGKGVFEKEIDEAIINGEVDFGVHSMKDVPADQPEGLVIAAIPERASPNDVLISRLLSRLNGLPDGATVGTGSPRRTAELLRVRPGLNVQSIRGNIDTRIRKLDSGVYDAIILAEAGLTRMGMQNRIVERLPIEDFTPAPGQGFLAVMARRDREDVLEILRPVNDPSSWAEAIAERSFMKEVGGGCKIPIGAFARAEGETVKLLGSVISPDGARRIDIVEQGDMKHPEDTGKTAANRILRMGAEKIIRAWSKP